MMIVAKMTITLFWYFINYSFSGWIVQTLEVDISSLSDKSNSVVQEKQMCTYNELPDKKILTCGLLQNHKLIFLSLASLLPTFGVIMMIHVDSSVVLFRHTC